MSRRIAALTALLLAGAVHGEELVDGIAAQVGNDIVLVSEVLQMVEPIEAELRRQGGGDEAVAQIRAEALERMIEWRLIEQMVKETELYASDEEIDDAIQSIADQNGITLEQLQESVSGHGLSQEDYRKQIKRELERRKVVSAMVASRVRIEEKEVRKAYEQRFGKQPEGGATIHVRQILVPFGKEHGIEEGEACAAVRNARRRIGAGEPFEVVASQVSRVAPERGGDLGWIHWDAAAPWMQEVVDQLEPGDVSDPLELPFGCGLLQLVERRDYEPVTWEQARPVLEQQLHDDRVEEELDRWFENLRKRTYIERRGYFADAAKLTAGEGSDSRLP